MKGLKIRCPYCKKINKVDTLAFVSEFSKNNKVEDKTWCDSCGETICFEVSAEFKTYLKVDK